MSENKNKNNKFSELKGIHRVVPIILVSAAVLISVLLIWGGGAIGQGIRGLLKGLFSFGAYIIPLAMCIHGICYPEDLEEKKITKRLIFFAVSVVMVSCIDYAIFTWGSEPIFFPGAAFINMNGGGLFGNVLGFIISKLFGQAGLIILCVAVIAIYATFFYAEKAGSLGQAALKVKNGFNKLLVTLKLKVKESKDKKDQLKEEEKRQHLENASEELMSDDFFTTGTGSSGVKVKQLGIDEEASPSGVSSLIHPSKRYYETEPEETIVVKQKPERKRRTADKPLDLNYGMEDAEIPAEKPEKKEEFNKAFFGIDDSADNVFTKDFDPFNFATGEKTAAKYANKVSISTGIEEELDEFTIYEMKANHVPSEREKRLADLERRKKEYMYQKQKREEAASGITPKAEEAPVKVNTISLFDSVSDPAIKKAPAYATSAAAFGAASDRRNYDNFTASVSERKDNFAPSISENDPDVAPTISPASNTSVESDVPSNVNTYTSYSTTKTTYHQPIKTVEFTITKEPKADPLPSNNAAPVAESQEPMAEATEDVAILIADRIARSNPAYARSANDLKTYTKVVSSSQDDDLFRQLSGMSVAKEDHTPVVQEADVVKEHAPEVIEFASAEEKLPETVEFSFGEQDATPEISPKTSYQRAAEFASAMVNESAPVSFKPYTPPVTNIQSSVTETVSDESTLKVERNMLPPTPEAIMQNQPATPTFEPLFTIVNNESEESAEELVFDEEDVVFDEIEIEEEVEEISSTEIPEEENVETEEIPPEEQNPEVLKMREMFPFLAPLSEQKKAQKEQPPTPTVIEENEEDDVPFDEPVLVKPTTPAPKAALVPVEDKKPAKKDKPDYSGYIFPSLELLKKEESAYDDNIQSEIQENADKLIETLASFNVTASIKGVDRGPRITRYEVVPAKGVKVSSILNLQDDIALNLAAGAIRMEAPIPGKSAVGIEIPNKKSSIVRLRDLLETADFQGSKSKTFVCIGRDVAGQPVFGDIAKMPHLLIAGATGMGKSVCINSLLISVLYKARPDEVKLIMIDPKQVEFTMYNGIPHLLVPVVSDPKQAAGALMWAVEEMERRYNLLNPLCVRNIEAYNEKVTADPSLGEPMPRIIIVIDEFADLMLQVKDPVETLVMRIAQKARAAGIYLVIGTQRPSVNVITGVIKANVPSRISCKVMSNVDSKTVLDSAGAEKLLDRGDALYAPAGSPKPHRVQCAFVADSEVESIMNYLKQYSDGSNYDSTVMEEIERAAQKCSKKGDRERDDDDSGESSGEGYLNDRQFLDAVEVAVNTRKISTSLIQRKLSIGYGKAAKFIDIMEDMGIVGEANGQRPREVLLTPDEWREKLARASLD